MGARHYDPRSGSFLSPDPVSYPVSLNLYSYADGDPINNSDLDGRFTSTVYMTTRATVIDAWNDTRFQGFLTVADGAWKTSAGLSMTVASEGFLAPVGVALSAQGIDSLYTGIRQMYTGEVQTKAFVQALEGAGFSRERSEMVNTCLSMVLDYKQAALKVTRLAATSGSTLCKTSTTIAKDYKPFTKNNTRWNLSVKTGIWYDRSFEAHHILPQKYRSKFAQRAINIDHPNNLTWWEKGSHRSNAADYTRKWDKFFDENPKASAHEILKFSQNIMTLY